MKQLSAVACGASLVILALGSNAQAEESEEQSYVYRSVRAPENAFEIGLGGGYSQGFGGIESGSKVQNLAHAGFAPELTLGWRATPGALVGLTGQYQEFKADNQLARGTNTRGLTTSIDAQFHGSPFTGLDPWIGIGAGYRLLYVTPDGPNNNSTLHGFQLAKLRLGFDLRVNENVALGPMIGADLNMFVWRNPEGPTGNIEIADKKVSTFLFGGLQGRFDLGGTRTTKPTGFALR